MTLVELAQSFLDRKEEDMTWIDPEDVRRMATAIVDESKKRIAREAGERIKDFGNYAGRH